jgi:hypothetical protein
VELAGGLMIIAIPLGLLLAAVWLSLPILLFSMRNRLVASQKALEELALRMASLEKRLEQVLPPPAACPARTLLKLEEEELDGIA